MLNPSDIESVAIHPGIGIARVGNAKGEDDYFFGPEVPGAGPHAPDGFRDASGHLKRQAARFRIYATLKNGEVVEVTAEDASIEWRVELANLKAGWYRFTTAMDLPRNLAVSCTRRNPDVGLTDLDSGLLSRGQLDIVPQPKKIAGVDQSGKDCVFDDGKFFDQKVYLGELRTDQAGRLIVLGGRGDTGAHPPDKAASTFANNDGWHDDISDGPVRATVSIGDRVFEADPAYVVVTPPNYGPGLFGVLTMDDVAREGFYAAGFGKPPRQPSFTDDIWPIFDRLSGNQWVNHGIFMLHGRGSPLDARNLDVVKKLADSSAAKPFRHAIFKLFRDPGAIVPAPTTLPPFYGDGIDFITSSFAPLDTSADLTLTPILQRMLSQWADGDFVSDWKGFPVLPAFADLSPSEQRGALDRANLYDLLGGPFHPGIELTWIMRRPNLWRAAYRLKITPEGTRARQDFGSELTPQIALDDHGPLSECGPGSLTRWLGVPWQTDAGSCGSGGNYTPTYYLSVPSFWAARVPNDVLPQAAYERLNDPVLEDNDIQRAKHFDTRKSWYRLIDPGRKTRAQAMVDQWWRLGVIEPVEAPAILGIDGPIHVEIPTEEDQPQHDPTLALIESVERLDQQHKALMSGFAAARAPQPPSARTFKPPRIHRGRGEA